MVLDRRKAYELAQALLSARNRKDGGNLLQNVAQTGTASGDRGYGEPVFGGLRHFSTSQPGVTAKAARQSHKPIPMPRPHPFRDPAGFSYTGEIADMAKARGAPLTTRTGFGVGPYQGPADRGAHIDNLRRRSWHHGGPAKINPPGHRATLLRPADGEPDMAKETPHQERKMPEIHCKTSGEIWSEFLGGIGKGIAQGFSDMVFEDAKARLATVDGIYIDTPNPVLFEPSTSWWDNTGRKIAPGITAVTGTASLKRLKPRRFKIGKVTPPKHLIPGTGPFGDYMHEEIVKIIRPRYPKTIFRDNVKRGQTGIDMEYKSGETQDFPYLEIKSDKSHSKKQLRRQIYNWGYEEPAVKVITYDEQGNIYEGFDD